MLSLEASCHLSITFSTHREAPESLRTFSSSACAFAHSSSLLRASVCAEDLPWAVWVAWPLNPSSPMQDCLGHKGTGCWWSLAVTIVPTDCESSSWWPVLSSFMGSPESQTYHLWASDVVEQMSDHTLWLPAQGPWWILVRMLESSGRGGLLDWTSGQSALESPEFECWWPLSESSSVSSYFTVAGSPLPPWGGHGAGQVATCTWLIGGREGIFPGWANSAKFPSSSWAALVCPKVLL